MAHILWLPEDKLKVEGIQTAAVGARRRVGHFPKSTIASDTLEKYQPR